jgi:hypothetical protein
MSGFLHNEKVPIDDEINFMKVIALLIVALIIYGLIVTSGSNKEKENKK